MSAENLDAKKRADVLYNYELYSLRQFRVFSKYAWKTAKEVSENYGGSRLGVWLHMMWCNLRYGANHNRDYTLFELYKKSGREIDTFLTHRRFFKLIKQFDKNTFYYLIDKANNYKEYASFIKRDWMLADKNADENKIKQFIKEHGKVLVKPVSSEQGWGVKTILCNDEQSIGELLSACTQNAFLVEEVCKNCAELEAINSSSLNTLRVFTIVESMGKIEIVSVLFRCGRNESVVDNWGSGGIGYHVDVKTGIIVSPGLDKKGNRYIVHPGTRVVMPGFRIPRYDDVCKLAKEIISVNKKVVYAGLDLAILPDRIELIEVNFPGGHDVFQAFDQVGKNPIIKRIFDE